MGKILAILGLFLACTTFGQWESETPASTTSIEWVVSPTIKALQAKQLKENTQNPKINGFQVQLFFGDREKAQKIRTEFLKSYPDMEATIDYLAPNFRVRVGAFRSHVDAYRFFKLLKDQFPGSYIVQDKINLPPLTSYY